MIGFRVAAIYTAIISPYKLAENNNPAPCLEVLTLASASQNFLAST